MKRRFFLLLWWSATLWLVVVAFGWWFWLSTHGSWPVRSTLVPYDYVYEGFMRTRVYPLVAIALAYAACFIGYGKPYRPPRVSDFLKQ